jgi:glycosyltransferase A (GT-A) superfamily protein (DUF2064 family)
MSMTGALAIFVKTPGLSAIKTRLADSVGPEVSEKFYRASLRATAACAREVQRQYGKLQVYWAVAESEGLDSPMWVEFPTVYQGEGSLGLRLSNVYKELLNRHQFVCFIGADSPHIGAGQLLDGVFETARNAQKKFILGETNDGGFYFFGGSLPVPEMVWTSVAYSSIQTANELSSRLFRIAGVSTIRRDFDVDTVDDLLKYKEDGFAGPNLLPEQLSLIQWVKSLSFARKLGGDR